ncbi:energy transducer TonB [Flammeovirga aprica]|uniref:TonB C-terminal domain-containing protein n=1 Tax=Flammeovirga aprica JL-4 TaxID=694437 RepID=A0A7X9XBZ4_9BACT|nr:energy transducer TonB [Flammeovirga aprica]NME71246.1 hypothetical protein [Flammeovirga aprica JL-4]
MRLIIPILLCFCSLTSFGQINSDNTNQGASKITSAKADSLENLEQWKSDPEFPGGPTALSKFLNDHIEIDGEDLGDQRQKKVFVMFTITENGNIEDVMVLKGISEKMDKKIKEIFQIMPLWKPAYLYGKPVRSRYSYPLLIKL